MQLAAGLPHFICDMRIDNSDGKETEFRCNNRIAIELAVIAYII